MSSEPSARSSRRALRIGKYEVLYHIATGGMGAVYKAFDVEQKRDVALKILPPETAAKPAMLERFHREARSAAKLRHENIVRIYEFGEANGTHFLALEFIDGIDLHEYINRKSKLPPEEVRLILIQAAKALSHAHKKGIVHRDIKPSNFLITLKNDRPVVKLTDLGLARETRQDDFRVTRDGTTVGTVDYMAPEQARDSGAADIRSDIYSLGCTAYHMLAGQPPFPDGGLTERIYKHAEAEPPDLRAFCPKISTGMQAILKRMLEKDPADRYQTPQELLRDLEGPDNAAGRGSPPSREILASLALGVGEAFRAKKKRKRDQEVERNQDRASSSEAAAPAAGRRSTRRVRDDSDPERSGPSLPIPAASNWQLWAIGAVVLAVLAVIGGLVFLASKNKENDGQPLVNHDNNPKPVARTDPGQGAKGDERPGPKWDRKPDKAADSGSKPAKEELPRLYQPRTALDLAKLRDVFKTPAEVALPANAPRFRVLRGGASGAEIFSSLADAVQKAGAGKTTVIEIHDNGPLFEPAMAVTGRSLVVRAGKGFRPLLAWDVRANRTRQFLSVRQGNLTLEGLDVVVRASWGQGTATEPATLFQVAGGRLTARGCTFSLSGRNPAGFAAFRLLPPPREGGEKAKAENVCQLDRCFVRGADLTAVAVQAPGAEVFLSNCLMAGGDSPLIQIAAGRDTATRVRVVRSTLTAAKTLLQVQPAGTADTHPAVHWYSWDALLAQSNPHAEGNLVALAPGLDASQMSWQPVNCLYAGWKRLLAGPTNISGTNLKGWQTLWKLKEGDKSIVPNWPADAPPDTEEAAPGKYRSAGTEAGFAATSGPGALGCDVDALVADWPRWPTTRQSWLPLTYTRFPIAAPSLPTDELPPDGEPLDLTRVNLGDEIAVQAKNLKAGDKLVLRLAGSGPCKTNPIRLTGIHLVLFFEPPKKEKGRRMPAPLELVPNLATAVDRDALIEVEDGTLEMFGGRIRFGNSRLAKLPRYMVQIRNGELRLFRCQLLGPLNEAPDTYRGLIHVGGNGQTDADKTTACAVNESVLVSNRVVVSLTGTGARLNLARSVVAAGNTVLHIDPGAEARLPLNIHCLLEKNTVAFKQEVLHLAEVAAVPTPAEPVVVQADNNLFLDPFTDTPHQAGLLRSDGISLSRGLLIWQGADNGYDHKRLHHYIRVGNTFPAAQGHAAWSRLWGTNGDQRPRLVDLPRARNTTFPLKDPQLQRLLLPAALRPKPGQPPLGADLKELGIGPKR
jgi:serine/threonine-protein kinase